MYQRSVRFFFYFCLVLLILLVGVIVDSSLRIPGHPQTAARWIKHLDLSTPAFWPSGTQFRHPGGPVMFMDTRSHYYLRPLAPHCCKSRKAEESYVEKSSQ